MPQADPLAGFGPFFATRTHAAPPGPPWLRMSELVTDGTALADRLGQVRTALAASGPAGEIEDRVAASVTQLGLTARLAAPVVALAVLGVADPVVELDDVFWQAELGGPFPLSLPAALVPDDPSPTPVDGALHAFVDGPVHALVDATTAMAPVSPHVLWGNVASTVHAAGQMVRTARPDLAARTDAVLAAALAHPLLSTEYERPQGDFRRRNCCLVYRIAPSARPRPVCADCVLDP